MGTSYVQLTAPERMGLTLLLVEGLSQRAAAARLGRDHIRVTAFWSGQPSLAEKMVAPFGTLGMVSSGALGGLTFLDLQRRTDDMMPWNLRYYGKGGFLTGLDDRAIECTVANVIYAPTSEENIYLLQLGGTIADVDEEATPYTARSAGYYWIVGSVWKDAADDAKILSWSRKAGGQMADISMRGNYVNEQGDANSDVARSAYGESKFARLTKLKCEYDPANLFRLNQNIEPTP